MCLRLWQNVRCSQSSSTAPLKLFLQETYLLVHLDHRLEHISLCQSKAILTAQLC